MNHTSRVLLSPAGHAALAHVLEHVDDEHVRVLQCAKADEDLPPLEVIKALRDAAGGQVVQGAAHDKQHGDGQVQPLKDVVAAVPESLPRGQHE